MRMPTLRALGLVAIWPTPVFAHTGQPIAPHDLWRAWTFEPLVVASLAVSAALYLTGLRRLWSKGKGSGIRQWEAASFLSGWAVLALSLVSPLHALGGSLFSAHMAQHELLIGVSAPLLVLGRPLVPFLWAVPPGWRRALGKWSKGDAVSGSWRALTIPAVAFGLHAVALWTWHLPGPYQATLTSDVMHTLQHSSFIITALLFWWTIFKVRRSELGHGAAVFFLFGTALQTGALGALLAFAPSLWYPAYAATTGVWGLSPLEDQQLGGLIMWIPGSLPYVIAALFVFARWLRDSESRTVRREHSMIAMRAISLLCAVSTLISCDRASGDDRYHLANADPDRGRTAIKRYGCGSCHNIPGVIGANGQVGPPLADVGQRVYIAGVLPNEPDNMIRWIENPPAIDAKTAMPYMGVTTRDARDIAAYLYSLR